MEKEFRYSQKVLFKEGDQMRISEGPYYECSSGTKLNMGVKGLHTFSHIDEQSNLWVRTSRGILVLVYMGEEKVSETTGTHFQPHKLRKVRKKK